MKQDTEANVETTESDRETIAERARNRGPAGAAATAFALLVGLATSSCCYDVDEPAALGGIDNVEYCQVLGLIISRTVRFHIPAVPKNLRSSDSNSRAMERAARIVTEPDALTFRAPADVPAPNVADVTLPYDLIPPFRVECTVGLCDPAFYPAPAAVFGLSVVERTGALREFSVDCSRVGGITATASFGTPTPQALVGAERVDLALEHDGTDLVAFARNHETGGAWFEISRAPVVASGPFIPKLGARDFDPGQMVSYFALRVPTNAPYGPGQATPRQEAVRKFAEALGDLAEGSHGLASATPDADAASLEIQAAGLRVQEALTALDTATVGKKPSPAARKLKKARAAAKAAAKRVTQAVAKISVTATQKQTTVVLKRVVSAALGLAQAADQILPDDLRAAIGGVTLKSFLGK